MKGLKTLSFGASISIAMATYNGLPHVRRQLASILDQVEATDQLVVVDDGSSDGTWEYLQGLQHPSLELVRNTVNQGIRSAFQTALQACRNEIIFLSDQDDIWLPNKRAAVLRAFLEEPNATIVISDARVIDENDCVTSRSFMATRGGFRGSVRSTIVKNRYLGCAMVLRRTALSLALPVPRGAPMHDMWLGVMGAIQGPVIYLDQPLLDYRRHRRNATPSTHQSLMQMIRWRVAFVAAIVVRVIGRRMHLTSSWPR